MAEESERHTFSKYASAIELLAAVMTIFAWAELERPYPLLVTLLAAGAVAGAFWIRLRRAATEVKEEAEVESAEAVVDREVLRALRNAPVPFSVVRAVKRIGDDTPKIPIREFRMRLRAECGPDLSADLTEMVVDFVRIPIKAGAPPRSE